MAAAVMSAMECLCHAHAIAFHKSFGPPQSLAYGVKEVPGLTVARRWNQVGVLKIKQPPSVEAN